MIAAIPTRYGGINFRSRLEARWAAMFDMLGWPYEYEPYDLPGWIPDFLIPARTEILIEVKPFTHFEEFDTGKIISALEKSGKDKWESKIEVLLLGCTVADATTFDGQMRLGWLSQSKGTHDPGEAPYCPYFGEAVLLHFEEAPPGKQWGLIHGDMSYGDRMGNGSWKNRARDSLELSRLFWNEAGNRVQWKPRAVSGAA